MEEKNKSGEQMPEIHISKGRGIGDYLNFDNPFEDEKPAFEDEVRIVYDDETADTMTKAASPVDKTEDGKIDSMTKVQQDLVNHFCDNLENEGYIWKQGWDSTCGNPVALGDRIPPEGMQYDGYNNILLSMIAAERGYTDNRWCTYDYMQRHGWAFKQGADGKSLGRGAGVLVEYGRWKDRATGNYWSNAALGNMTAEEKAQYEHDNAYLVRCVYRVFNADIIEGIPANENISGNAVSVKENGILHGTLSSENVRAEKFLADWNEQESLIKEDSGEPYYDPVNDEIHIARKDSYPDSDMYFNAALKGIARRAVGKEQSKTDAEIANAVKYGIGGANKLDGGAEDLKAKNELTAEISSVFMCRELEVNRTDESNAAYIDSWLTAVRNDPKSLVEAIGAAGKISKDTVDKEKGFMEKRGSSKEVRESDTVTRSEDLYKSPKEIAKEKAEARTAVDMTGRGRESLSAEDAAVVAAAENCSSGNKFRTLYSGGQLYTMSAQDEQSMMSRIAMFTDDRDQMIRIFKSSGQYREGEGTDVNKLADTAIKFTDLIKSKSDRRKTAAYYENEYAKA